MRVIECPTNYYQQFDADYTVNVPAKGYGGWKKTNLPLNLDKTGIVMMHSMFYGTHEQVPGIFAACEYIPRAYAIGRTVMPTLLDAVRKANMKVLHVVGSTSYCKEMGGYKKAVEIGGAAKPFEQVDSDPVLDRLRTFKAEHGFPGKHNKPSYEKGASLYDFDPNTKPKKDEAVVENEQQLLAFVKEYGLNHLIYIGYNINWCIQFSNGGYMHIYRNGVMCSTIRQAVTAVENKESAANDMGLEMALWTIAVGFGYVYDVHDFVSSIQANP